MKRFNIALSLLAIYLPSILSAQTTEGEVTVSYFSNPLFNTLMIVIIILAIMVLALSSALRNLMESQLYVDKLKKVKESKTKICAGAILIGFMLLGFAANAQEKVMPLADDGRIGGLDQFTFYFLVTVIMLELLALGVLFNTFKKILSNTIIPAEGKQAVKTKSIFDKLNDTVSVEEEETLMLDHDYDGIKELDNNLPPWWKYGFYLTIVIGVIYMINYHVTKSSPLQAEEYAISVKKAQAEIAEYMKKSANNVDETTVKLLSDNADLAVGKDLFMASCAACHGKLGEGTVGPNLTDDYWLHGGGLKDVFKSIKYGWPDKGMKSWKEDFSPMQIAQLTSYIKTLKGTNPPKAKEKQGDLYTEEVVPVKDSAAVVIADTTAVK